MPKDTYPTISYYSIPQLKERGWTIRMIVRFLDPPDKLTPNPHYLKAAPMRLYLQSRVETIEAEPALLEAKSKAAERSQRGKMIAARKAQQLIEQAERIPITVKYLTLKLLRKLAIQSYNEWNDRQIFDIYHYSTRYNSNKRDAAFLERITVNFIRHHLTSYDRQLEETAGKVGVQAAIEVIRCRVYHAIAEAYPVFRAECDRQLEHRESRANEANVAQKQRKLWERFQVYQFQIVNN